MRIRLTNDEVGIINDDDKTNYSVNQSNQKNVPRKLWDFTNKVQIGRLVLGLGVNVGQTDIVPEGNFAVAVDGLHSVVDRFGFALMGQVEVNAGTARR